MALRDKLRHNATPCVQSGETIQAIFVAQTASGWLALLAGVVILLANGYRVVIVTDRRILVCQGGRVSVTKIKGVIRELPRGVRIGPAEGLWYRCDSLGERLYIHKRFDQDIRIADGV